MYGLRLVSAISERSFQEILDLMTWLPEDSAFMAAHRANGNPKKTREFYRWGVLQDLSLFHANILQDLHWMYAQSHTKKTIKRPEPISGPSGNSTSKPSGGDANAMAKAMLAAARGG